jgi:hypothetical protein
MTDSGHPNPLSNYSTPSTPESAMNVKILSAITRERLSFHMRKIMPASSQILICALLSSTRFGIAQQASIPQSSLPTDPKVLISLVAQSNGLAAQDIQPWHMKVAFKLLDAKGNTTDQGAFEEYWAGPSKFKRTFISSGFTQTEFGVTDGLRRTGSKDSIPGSLSTITNEFIRPINLEAESIEGANLSVHEIANGAMKLSCLGAVKNASMNPPAAAVNETYCLNESTPILRIHFRGNGFRIIRNNIIRFQGKYLPQNIEAYQMGISQQPGTLLYTAHLEMGEIMKTWRMPNSFRLQMPSNRRNRSRSPRSKRAHSFFHTLNPSIQPLQSQPASREMLCSPPLSTQVVMLIRLACWMVHPCSGKLPSTA